VAVTRGDVEDHAVWFTAIAAVVAFLGFGAAGAAVYVSEALSGPKPIVRIDVLSVGDVFEPDRPDLQLRPNPTERSVPSSARPGPDGRFS
jgi:hypothetical protein